MGNRASGHPAKSAANSKDKDDDATGGPSRRLKKGSIVPAIDTQSPEPGAAAATAAAEDASQPDSDEKAQTNAAPVARDQADQAAEPSSSDGDVDQTRASSAYDQFMTAYVDKPGQERQAIRLADLESIPDKSLGLVLTQILAGAATAETEEYLSSQQMAAAQKAACALATQEDMLSFIHQVLVHKFPVSESNDAMIDLEAAAKYILGSSPQREDEENSDTRDRSGDEKVRTLLQDKAVFAAHFANIHI